MSTDANGNFSLPPSYFVQTGDTLLPVQHNPPFESVAQGLTARVMKDGRTVMTGNLQMGGNRVTNVADPALPSDAMTRRVSGFEFETRADAEAWPGVVPMPESLVIRGDASVDDGMGGTFVLGHPSSDIIVAAGESYGRVILPDVGAFKNAYRYKQVFSIPGKFSAYDDLVANHGYTSLYASGHVLDYTHREIWVVWPATGGDSANWFVVYDMDSLDEKTYFKAGLRWSKCFVVRDTATGRELLTTNVSDTYFARYDVSNLPAAGSSLAPATVETDFSGRVISAHGNVLMTGYEWVETSNAIAYSSFTLSDIDTLGNRGSIRVSPSVSGNPNGENEKLLKTQGVALCAGYLAFAYGGLTDTGTDPLMKDKRDIQGIALVDFSGNVIASGMFSPISAMGLLANLGYQASRFEHEGVFYSPETGKITTIWHYGDRDQPFMIVEAFSDEPGAFDMSSGALEGPVNVPPIASLIRNDRATHGASDPATGDPLSTIIDVLDMMDRYEIRYLTWYSTNFPIEWFDGSNIPASRWVKIDRAHNEWAMITVETDNISFRYIARVVPPATWTLERSTTWTPA